MPTLTRQQIHDYLDGKLSPEERREVLHLIASDDRNRRRFDAEADLRDQLQGLHQQTAPTPDLGGLLPSIFAEAQQPATWEVNRRAVMILLTLMVIIGFPLSRPFDVTTFGNTPPPLNIPATPQPHMNTVETEEPLRIQSTRSGVEHDLRFASPVPLPQSTAIASAQPPN